MARYAIYAYDGIFEGLHGMNSKLVMTCDNLREATQIAEEESLEVIHSYPAIYESIEQDLEDAYGDEFDEYYDEFMNDDIAYNIYEINEDVASEYSNEELYDMFYNDEDTFIQKYCLRT